MGVATGDPRAAPQYVSLLNLCKEFGKFITVDEESNSENGVRVLLADCDLTKVPHIIPLAVE